MPLSSRFDGAATVDRNPSTWMGPACYTASMECLDENEVVDFIEGRMDPSLRVAAEEHLARCAECRRVLARTAEALLPTGTSNREPVALLAPLRGLHSNDMVGRYRVLHRVGAGAMGVVYAAEDTELRRKVALKLLRADPSQPVEALGARLKREARAASAIRHPNVVPVHDVLALEDGSPVLVMDLLVGEPLRAKLDRDGPLDLQQTVRILSPVLSALEAAHALGVVHRDLKPDNIFLSTSADGSVDVKIVDFGVAKLTATEGPAARSAGLTETGALVGTPFYMSPEQAFGEKNIDARADLWAVGVILYECLTGLRPTEAENMGQVLKILAHLSFPPIERTAPDLPPELASLVGALLCERDGRRKSAAEVRHELLEIGATSSGRTRPKGPLLRTGIAVAAVSLVGFIVLALSQGIGSEFSTEVPADSVSESGLSSEVKEPTPVVPALSSGTTAPLPVASTSASKSPKDPVRLSRPKIAQPAVSAPASSFLPPSRTADPTKLMTEPPF